MSALVVLAVLVCCPAASPLALLVAVWLSFDAKRHRAWVERQRLAALATRLRSGSAP